MGGRSKAQSRDEGVVSTRDNTEQPPPPPPGRTVTRRQEHTKLTIRGFEV